MAAFKLSTKVPLLFQTQVIWISSRDKIVQISTLKDKEFNSGEALRVAVSKAMGSRTYRQPDLASDRTLRWGFRWLLG